MEADEIGFGCVFPTILEFLGISTTALVETGIADFTIVGEYLSARIADGFLHVAVTGHRDTLITLTVVIGTDIEDGVILAIVPTDEFVIFLYEREETVSPVLVLSALLHLGEEPGT